MRQVIFSAGVLYISFVIIKEGHRELQSPQDERWEGILFTHYPLGYSLLDCEEK